MVALTSRGVVFLGLNGVRLASISALALVFASIIVLMVEDSRAYSVIQRNGDMATVDETCDYLPATDIPTTPWGLFWVQLDRSMMLCACLLCVIAEVSVRAVEPHLDRLVPILGPHFSTVPIGIIQIMTSSSLLSHFMMGFTLVVPWLLFFVGIVNVTLGIAFGKRIKLRRSMIRSKRDRLKHAERLSQGGEQPPYYCADGVEKGHGGGTGTRTGSTAGSGLAPPRPPSKANVLRTLAFTRLDDAVDRLYGSGKRSKTEPMKRMPEGGSGARKIGRPSEAFRSEQGSGAASATARERSSCYGGHKRSTSCSSDASAAAARSVGVSSIHTAPTATPEMLRQRARIENRRTEREQERLDTLGGGMSYAGHSSHGSDYHHHHHHHHHRQQQTWGDNYQIERLAFASHHRRSRSDAIASLQERIAHAQASASRDLASPRSASADAHGQQPRPQRLSAVHAALRRRTLVLSRMVQQVKYRGPGACGAAKRRSGRGAGAGRLSRPMTPIAAPTMPLRSSSPTRRRSGCGGLLPPVIAPSAWLEVDRSAPPPHAPAPTYAPGRTPYLRDRTVVASTANHHHHVTDSGARASNRGRPDGGGVRTEYYSMLPIASRYARS